MVLGERKCMLLGLTFSALGLVFLGTLPVLFGGAYAAILISCITLAIGSGFIEVSCSPIVDRIPNKASGALVSILHSFYCWGHLATALLSTLFLFAFSKDSWWVLSILWAAVPAVNIFLFIKSPLPDPVNPEERKPVRKMLRSRSFIFLFLLILAFGAAEQSIAQWASMFAEDTLGVSKTVGDILGPCVFALFMGLGRMLMGVFATKLETRKALMISSAMLVFSILLITLPKSAYLSFMGMALFGLGVSIGWPSSLILASERHRNGGGPMFALMSIGGDLGCASGPFLVGIISELASGSALGEMKTGILASLIFPVMTLLLLMLLKERKN